jgi:O-methyltransferase
MDIMKLFKKILIKAISALGYEIRKKKPVGEVDGSNQEYTRLEKLYVKREVFTNLASAYELLKNESVKGKVLIKPNTQRFFLLSRLMGTPPSEAYFLIQALMQTELVDGDVCEFGVAQGETSALIASEIYGCREKVLHLFDSFEGLPKPSNKDKLKDDIFALGNIDAYAGTMKCPEDMVLSRLAAISFPSLRFVVHKGFIENLIHADKNLPTKVSFAYIDFDFYEPIKIALNFLHSVTSSGSIIIVDDYDFFSTGVKDAVDEFIKDKNSGVKIYDILIPDKHYGCFAILTKQ